MAQRPASPPAELETLARRAAAQVRARRAEHDALRGAFWGAVAAAFALLGKVALGDWATVVAGGLVVAGVVIGALWGAAKRVDQTDAARLVDRSYGLQDRVATALEWSGRTDRTPLVDALLADAAERVRALESRRIVPRAMPREARWLPIPVVIALVLGVSPPVPLPSRDAFDFSAGAEGEAVREPIEGGTIEEARRTPARDPLRSRLFEERDFVPRGAGGAPAAAGDLSAIFKDTALTTQRPDFASFLKKGDERLRLLESLDRLPDLQSDYTASRYQMVFRKSKALGSGLRPDQISPEKLRELLDEMERLGRKGGSSAMGSDVAEGMEALEYGQTDRALDAMERALAKLRAMEERERSGRTLRGGRERGGRGDRGRAGGDGLDMEDFGEGVGFLPGRGKSATPKGEASPRLRGSPYDVGVEGEMGAGRKQGYDTNLTGRAGRMGSRLTYLGVIGQYRKLMEDAIAREQIPRDYHSQIKGYFEALDER